jgi:hypothetical protein
MSITQAHHDRSGYTEATREGDRLEGVAALQNIIRGLVSQVCAIHGISQPKIVDRFATGTHPAFHLNAWYDGKERNVVVKLLLADQDGESFFARECAGYSLIGGSPVKHLTPRLLAFGALQSSESCPGCSYIIVSFAKGVCVNQGFLIFSPEEQNRFAQQVGEALRGLHGTEIRVAQSPALSSDRLRKVLEANVADILQHNAEYRAGTGSWRGLSSDASRGAAEFVRRNVEILNDLKDVALLHGDPHRDHFFVKRAETGSVELSGIIDFADAVFFDPLYDFTSVHMDLFGGDLGLLTTALQAYGIEGDAEVRKKLMFLSLIHEFDIFERIERDRVIRPIGPLSTSLANTSWEEFRSGLFGLGRDDE